MTAWPRFTGMFSSMNAVQEQGGRGGGFFALVGGILLARVSKRGMDHVDYEPTQKLYIFIGKTSKT